MNNYYTFTNAFVSGTIVRSSAVNQELNAIEAAFDELPGDKTAINRGTAILGVDSGSGSSYVLTMNNTRGSYQEGDRVLFRATHENIGSADINVDGLGVLQLVRADDSQLQAGDIIVGMYVHAVFHLSANHFQMLGPTASYIADASDRVSWATEWATKAEDSLISVAAGGNGTTDYSSLHHAAKSATSAAAALASEGAAATSETNAGLETTYAAEWANKTEDLLISAAAGGDQIDDYSALHWANKAAASAASTNLPAIGVGDAGKMLEVNVGETGYDLTTSVPASYIATGNLVDGVKPYVTATAAALDHKIVFADTWDVASGNFSLLIDNTSGDFRYNPSTKRLYVEMMSLNGSTPYSSVQCQIQDNATGAGCLLGIYTDDGGPWPFSINNATYDTGELYGRGMRLHVGNTGESRIYAADNATTAGTLSFYTDDTKRLEISNTGVADFQSNTVQGVGDLLLTGVNPFILGGDTDGYLRISGGSAASSGANIILYGQSHAGNADDIVLLGSADIAALWDDSASLWKFYTHDLQTTGTITAGTVTADNVTAGTQVAPNLILNGGFTVWQKGTTITSPSNAALTADMWKWGVSGIADVDLHFGANSSTTVPQNANYITVDVTGADVTLGAGDYTTLNTRIAGHSIAELYCGTAAAATVTLSFWHRHSKTGTYSVSFRNGVSNRSYIAEYTQTTTLVWEKAEITLTMDTLTSAVWYESNAIGLIINFTFSCGSTLDTASLNQWLAGNFIASTNQVNAMDNVANSCRIGQVKLEIGGVATPFRMLGNDYADEYQQCLFYFERQEYASGDFVGTGQAANATTSYIGIPYSRKRITPTVTTSGATHWTVWGATGTALTSTGVSVSAVSKQVARLQMTVSTGLVSGNASNLSANGGTRWIDIDATL